MSDRIYLRANFSSATAPPSSGAQQEDAEGNRYARIPLQLPSNIVDMTRSPSKVEMMLTKLSLPLGCVPITQIPVKEVIRQKGTPIRMKSTIIRTKLLFAIWPFTFDGHGNILPNQYVRTWYDPLYQVYDDPFPCWNMDLEVDEVDGSPQYIDKMRKIEREGVVDINLVEDLTRMLSLNLSELLRYVIDGRGDWNAMKWHIDFKVVNSRLQMGVYMEGGDITDELVQYFPMSWRLFRKVFNDVTTREGDPLFYYTQTGEGQIDNRAVDTFNMFSIVGNKELVSLLPGLPWRAVDNSTLTPFDMETGAGQALKNWTTLNEGDSMFYVLDTSNVNVTFGPETKSLPTSSSDTATGYDVGREVIYSFDNLNLISLVPINSFVVMLNGLTMTPQTYPVNINPRNVSAAQTTTIPIIEVYYPMWNSIEDLSTNLVVSKDAFTNAAPFVLGPDALQERNLTFEVYYVTNDGGLHLMTIPPGSCVNLQICYSISYY